MPSRTDTSDRMQAISTAFGISQRAIDGRTSVISVEGELDLSSAPQLKWILIDAIEEGRSGLVVDLSGATFMDSTALGVLVGVNRSLDEQTRLAIVCDEPNVLRIFELSGMDGAFAIFAELEQALTYTRGNTTPVD